MGRHSPPEQTQAPTEHMTQPSALRCYSFVLKATAQTAQQMGADPLALLEGTGIDPIALEDPYHRITGQQELDFYENLLTHMDIPELGLEMGRKSSLALLGSAGHIQLVCDDTSEVVAQSQKYLALMYSHINWQTAIVGDTVTHVFRENYPLGKLQRFLTERLVATIQTHSMQLLGPDCHGTRLNLSYGNPGYQEIYEEIFQCPVKFNQPVTELHYPLEIHRRKLPNRDPKLKQVLNELCQGLLDNLNGNDDVIADVKFCFLEQPGYFPSIEEVSEKLGLSSRHLRRHLKARGTTFQELLNDLRREIATGCLKHKDYSVQEISERCGFSSAQNFAQAFKSWTGQTPSEFRQQHQP